jgi:hypothetical protein
MHIKHYLIILGTFLTSKALCADKAAINHEINEKFLNNAKLQKQAQQILVTQSELDQSLQVLQDQHNQEIQKIIKRIKVLESQNKWIKRGLIACSLINLCVIINKIKNTPMLNKIK